MSHILLTYHVDILDLLTVTNHIRQNLTANFLQVIHVLWSCHLEFSPPTCYNATSVNTFKSLYLKWKRLNDH